MPTDSRTRLRHTGSRRVDAARTGARNNSSRFPIQWPARQSFDGNAAQVDVPVSGHVPSGTATRDLGDNTLWLLRGFSGITVQLLVNNVSRGTIPNTPGSPLNGGQIDQGDLVQVRKVADPDGSGVFTVEGFDASGHPIAFGKFEAR